MSFEVKIPAVGESITSGLIAQWHVADGAEVQSGDLLLTLETDKISTEITAEHSGTIKFISAEGDEVAIGAVVATIEEGAASGKPAKKKRQAKKKAASAAPREEPEPAPVAEAKDAARPVPEKESGLEVLPARKPAALADTSTERFTRKKLSPLRRKIADHLVSAQQNAALLTTFNECDMGEVMSLRKQVQEDFVAKHGIKLGFMSFFVKACVAALKAVPGINSRIEGDSLITNHFYDIGVAIGTDKGLFVPVIRDCDQKSFAEIERDIADYAKKAREGKIQLEDLSGGVFTITNGGIYGSMLSTPIINPPQSGILGMHNIQQRPMAVDGEVVIRPMMYLALSYDHRVVDGKEAVTFLVKVKGGIEQPTRLMLGI
ncbi:MAG: dihydrolipoyllysine-residue succinyltransferase [Verrucomicrobiales bacterium]